MQREIDMKKLLAVVSCTLISLSATAGFAEVTFDFEGYPEEIKGPAGARWEFTAFATLTCSPGEIDAGWGLSMTADGGKIVDVSVDGLTVMTDQGEMPLYKNTHFRVSWPTREEESPPSSGDNYLDTGGRRTSRSSMRR